MKNVKFLRFLPMNSPWRPLARKHSVSLVNNVNGRYCYENVHRFLSSSAIPTNGGAVLSEPILEHLVLNELRALSI